MYNVLIYITRTSGNLYHSKYLSKTVFINEKIPNLISHTYQYIQISGKYVFTWPPYVCTYLSLIVSDNNLPLIN